jgi:hypothetical protein
VLRNNKLVTRKWTGAEEEDDASVWTEKVCVSGNWSVVEEGATSVWTENAAVVGVDWVVEVVVSVWTNGVLVTRSCSTIVVLDWIRFSLSEHFSNRAHVNCFVLQQTVTKEFVFSQFTSELNNDP